MKEPVPEQRAIALKRFDVQTATLHDTDEKKPGVVMRLYINDSATGRLQWSDLLAMEAKDAVSLGQLLIQTAQEALAGAAPKPAHGH